MFKKMLLVVMLFFSLVHASNQVADEQFQELVYSMGMVLAEQDDICDQMIVENACIAVTKKVPAIEQILQLFLSIDPEMKAHNVDSVESLIAYEFAEHYDLAVAAMIWLAAFQDVFIIFNDLHPQDASFDTWRDDLAYLESWTDASYFEQDPEYAVLLHACMVMMEAQESFAAEFKALEKQLS